MTRGVTGNDLTRRDSRPRLGSGSGPVGGERLGELGLDQRDQVAVVLVEAAG